MDTREISLAFFNIKLDDLVIPFNFSLIKNDSGKLFESFIKDSFDGSGKTLDFNDFSYVPDFGKLIYFVHVTSIDTKLAHVHFKGVTIHKDQLRIV